MHRFHLFIPSSLFLIIFNLLVSQSLGSWVYPSPESSVIPVFNYIDTMNTSWTPTIPEPHVLLIWCHAQESSKDYYLCVYNKTLPTGHNSQEVVLNFGDRAWELCHFELTSTLSSPGKYNHGPNSPNFRISKTDPSEPITWGETVPGVKSTSQINLVIPTSALAEKKVLASDVFPNTKTNQIPSAITPFTSPPSSSSSSSSARPPRSLSTFASSSSLTNSSAPSPDHPAFPPSSHALNPTSRALIGVGIVVCLSLVLAIISMFFYNRKRQSHQNQHQQHQGLSGPPGHGGKAQQQNKYKEKPKIYKRHRYPLIELAGEEVANELEGCRPGCEAAPSQF